jgi:hypothetical protein
MTPTIAGRIVVFRVRKQPYWRTADRALGWGNRSVAHVDVQVIPGEHGTLLRPPHVRELAITLRRLIPGSIQPDGSGLSPILKDSGGR